MEKILYDTFLKELRVRGQELKQKKIKFALKQKCNMLFVDYRNFGTGFLSHDEMLTDF